MALSSKTRIIQDSFVEALHSEVVAGTENLSSWLRHLQERKGIDPLFELETGLKGLRAFFDLRFLPLSDAERNDLVNRSFAGEVKTIRQGIQTCERSAAEVVRFGQPEKIEFDAFVEKEMRRDSVLNYHISQMLEQPTPGDSLARLSESLNDLRVMLDAFDDARIRGCQVFLSLGRTFYRDLKSCRYIDMLLSQRFRLQYDRVDNPALITSVRGITEERLRRNAALALLYFYRFLRYLRMIERDMVADQPLRRVLVLFSLLQEEIGYCVDFLKSRFLKNPDANADIRSATELIVYSLRTQSKRILEKELVFTAQENEADRLYEKIENSHGLLRSCCQNSITALAGALDDKLDATLLFPSMADSQQRAQRLRQELWGLRQTLRNLLEVKGPIDFDGIIEKLATFRESSLRDLMFKDWGEFEAFSDSIVTSASDLEVRALMRQFVSYLETLVQEVSNRSVLKGKDAAIQGPRK